MNADRLSQLLGSPARAKIIRILASTITPVSAYRVAKIYDMNVNNVYSEIKKLANLGLVSTVTGKRGAQYALIDKNLRALALKLSPNLIGYDEWSMLEVRARRIKSEEIKVPNFLGKKRKPSDILPREILDGLNIIALTARKSFDKKYRQVGEHDYVRVRE